MEMTPGVRWSTWLAPFVTNVAPRMYAPFRGRPRRPWRAPDGVEVEHWTAVSDGQHNLTTDLTWWRDRYWLVHSSTPWHLASADSKLVLWSSPDARAWTRAAEFRADNGDIRDPKLAVIGDRLFLYVLRNDGFVAEPNDTAFTVSDDGVTWAPLRACGPRGWLLWRPKAFGGTWYVPAYWHEHGRSILLSSRDGEAWTSVSTIHEGGHNDETDLEFLPDGRAVVTARLEMSGSMFGHDHGCTLVAQADPPYTSWRSFTCPTTRLDGPNLFGHGGAIFAAGRHHPPSSRDAWWDRRGGFFGRRKRTALYAVGERGLTHLFDLPSAGDTGYPGVVVRPAHDELTICYYTNDPSLDPPWVVGMVLPSEIRIARLSLAGLARLAAARAT
jgi:hypothetical protein